jgi:hypothetical protein
MSLGMPARRPLSTSALLTQSFRVLAEHPILAAIETIACQRDPCCAWLSGSIRTARSRTSGENLVVVAATMAPSYSRAGASGKPGVVQNAVRLQLHPLACNLTNLPRTLATPGAVATWSLAALRERLVKTVARLVRHARFAVFQFAEAALPRAVFAGVLDLINGLRGPLAEAACT